MTDSPQEQAGAGVAGNNGRLSGIAALLPAGANIESESAGGRFSRLAVAGVAVLYEYRANAGFEELEFVVSVSDRGA
jgi:hypothetical protein